MVRHLDSSTINDAAHLLQRVLCKEIAPSHKIVVTDLHGSRNQTCDIDLSAGPKQNAVGIDEEEMTVRLKMTKDDGGVNANDPVKGNGAD